MLGSPLDTTGRPMFRGTQGIAQIMEQLGADPASTPQNLASTLGRSRTSRHEL